MQKQQWVNKSDLKEVFVRLKSQNLTCCSLAKAGICTELVVEIFSLYAIKNNT